MTPEIQRLLEICEHHMTVAGKHIENGDYRSAEFRARELSENAKLLSSALFRAQRVSGEVK